MKRILIVVLCLVLTLTVAVSLTACGSGSKEEAKSSQAESSASSETVIDEEDEDEEEDEISAAEKAEEPADEGLEAEDTDDEAEAEPEPAAEPAPEEKIGETEWSELIAESEDQDGHRFELRYKLSPWMLVSSNAVRIKQAWDEVGGDNKLPDVGDWPLKEKDSYSECKISKTKFSHSMNDMYYCVGTVTVTNLTENMPISKSDKASAPLYFVLNISPETANPKGSKANCIFRFYRPKGVVEDSFSLETEIKMSKDSYGPLPFIIMVPESVTKEHPEGINLESVLKSYFKYDGGQGLFQVSAYDKNGKQSGPMYTE